ncbi:hypothetical protein DEO72_LG2g2859 [Vigna unguiculata]|uniref:Uncharacterized protein n=1 Tax=Vigna unguiculata TaxID=3917 RepID=A0A4D6L202_VIGUN|nr:hypothetical protein DEO72_LG2g2859 [Vigna unguiculata]
MNLPVHIITCQTPSMNLPAHGTASPDPSKASLSIKNNTPESNEQQHFRLARPTRRQAKLFQTAWRYLLTARRQRPPRLIVFPSPPGGAHRAARRLSSAGSLTLRLSPGGAHRAARRLSSAGSLTLRLSPDGCQPTTRRHIRSIQQLFLAHSLIWFQLEHYHNHYSSHSSVHYASYPTIQ